MRINPNFSAFPTALQIDASKPYSSKIGTNQRGDPRVLQANGCSGAPRDRREEAILEIHELLDHLRKPCSDAQKTEYSNQIKLLRIEVRRIDFPGA